MRKSRTLPMHIYDAEPLAEKVLNMSLTGKLPFNIGPVRFHRSCVTWGNLGLTPSYAPRPPQKTFN
jgi:hypothetical protein